MQPSKSQSTSQPPEKQVEIETLRKRLDRERRARVAAEKLLEQKSAELYDAAEDLKAKTVKVRMLASAVDAITDGLSLTDASGHFVHMNSAHAQMFGYTPAELLNKHWSVLYNDEVRDQVEVEALPEIDIIGFWRGELVGRSASGTPVYQEVILSSRPEGGLVCTSRDIEDRRNREIETRELEARLLKAEREAALFTIGNAVAHDFNNLIAAISGYALLLQMELDEGSQQHERARRISEAADQASGVVRALEVDRSNDVRTVEPIDLAALLRTGLAIADAIRPQGVRTEISLPESAIVSGNEVMISRALINITKNAFEAMGDRGKLSIRLGKQRSSAFDGETASHKLGETIHEPEWVLELTDNGPGIPAEKLARIFVPFETTKRAIQGTGLGLLSLTALSESRAVSIEVESAPGQGTCFRLLFPRESVPAFSDRDLTGHLERLDSKDEGSILVVDDNHAIGEMLVDTLARLGFSATWFSDPQRALELVRSSGFDFDLLLTDLTMPGMAGDELARAAKAARPDLPVILYSGQAGYLAHDPIYSAVLTKPILPEKLATAVRRALDNQAWRSMVGL